ncbi:MAG TPA: hypothetical protein VGC91_01485 [Pyrinomonadaceae bacterium]|jgi:hypothetical protein
MPNDEFKVSIEKLRQAVNWLDSSHLADIAQELAYLFLTLLRKEQNKNPAVFDNEAIQNLED